MKRCPECRRDYYDDSLLYCLDDGTALLEGPSSVEPSTAVLPEGVSSPGKTTYERATKIYTTGDRISKEIKAHKTRSALIAAVVLVVLAGFGYGIYSFIK